MTNFFIRIYHFFDKHRVVWVALWAFLLCFFGYFSTKIYLEEDIARLLPSSRNEDGSIKLAFSSLRIKDKTFIIFHDREGIGVDSLSNVVDAFCDSIQARDNQRPENMRTIGNLFSQVHTDDIMFEGIDYMMEHLPNYIDTSAYAGFDTLQTEAHILKQLQENKAQATSLIGEAFPELLQIDPIGMRYVLMDKMKGLMNAGGSYSIVNQHLFVPDSTVAAVVITPRFASTDSGNGAILFQWMNEYIEQFETIAPGVKIGYHGSPANGAYNSWTLKKDIKNNIMWSLIIVLLVIFLCFRNWNTIPLLLLPVLFGTVFGLAMMYFIKGQFSLLALGIGAIVLGVALSYVLHVITHYKYVGDPVQVLKDQVKPVLMGCITTIGSFLGLIFIQTDLLQDFGLFATFAIVGTTVFSLAFLPPFFNERKNKLNRHAFKVIDRINAYPIDRNKPLLAIIAVLTVVCVAYYLIGGTNFDADMRNLGYWPNNLAETEALVREKTDSGDRHQYFAASGATMEEAIENFSLMAEKLDSLQEEGLVTKYTHTSELFIPKRVQQERIDAWHNYWTEERLANVRALINKCAPKAGVNAAAFEPFFVAATRDYEPDALYEQEFIPEGYRTTLMEQTYDGSYLCFSTVYCENDSVRSDSTDYHRICDAVANEPNLMVLDTYYYAQDTLRQLGQDFNVLQWVSMAFVLLVLLISFRFNLKNSLLCFLPIVISWIIVLGAMNIFGIRFNLINIIISTFIFGIGVDYSIFVMNGLIGKGGADTRHNKLLAYHKTAILFSALALIVTVGSMNFAVHPAIRSVGFATLVGMIAAVLFAYVVEPFLYRLLSSKGSKGSKG